MCDDGGGPRISRRQALWVPAAAVGATLLGASPAEAATRRVALLQRSAWDARPPSGPFVRQQISHITIHHSAVILRDNRQAPTQLRTFQADHQARGWPDIAYHLLIDRHGNVYQGRPIWAVGDTNTSYNPRGHLLVMALGNFEEQAISAPQFSAMLNVLAWGSFPLRHRSSRDPRTPGLCLDTVPRCRPAAPHLQRHRAAPRATAPGSRHDANPERECRQNAGETDRERCRLTKPPRLRCPGGSRTLKGPQGPQGPRGWPGVPVNVRVATGVNADGHREILGLQATTSQDPNEELSDTDLQA